MSKQIYTLGLSKIEVGDIAEDGAMGTELKVLGYTYQNSAKMTQDDPETTDHYAEEVDDPVISIDRGGKTNFAFSIMNPSVTVLAELLGGKADDAQNTWDAPDTIPTIEKSVRITPTQGLKFDIPRMKMVAKINGDFSKQGILLIEVSGTVMKPTKDGTSKMKATLLASEA